MTGYRVVAWCPDKTASKPPDSVAFVLDTDIKDLLGRKETVPCQMVMRLKTTDAVDELIDSFMRLRAIVWPEAEPYDDATANANLRAENDRLRKQVEDLENRLANHDMELS